ncbi:MAG TPA: NAD-dependent epimerase/dehydratase family protein [Gemmatimonadaceae bacterium]
MTTDRGHVAPRTEAELDEILSRPTADVIRALEECPGDIAVLGAGGKMGPTLARMIRRAADQVADPRRVLAVSRFSATGPLADTLSEWGIEVVRADLTDWASLASLPETPNVIFLAGQKFGTRSLPATTWVTNVVVPALVADRFRGSRLVALSTGNVYPLTSARGGGSREDDPPGPIGEYAWSCVGRERVLEHASRTRGTPVAIVRLNYAVDLRYGVLVDLALKVANGTPVDLRMGYVNVIWQRDAAAQVVQALAHAGVPPFVVNVAGPEILSVREVALEFGRLLGREPVFTGTESADALLSNTTRAQSLFGAPSLSAWRLVGWVADWILQGGITLGRPTHFEQREGSF